MRRPLEPVRLLGRTLSNAFIGWHVHGETRTPVHLLLEVDGVGLIDAHTAGDGSLQLVPADPPQAFDMEQYGRFEFETLPPDHVLAPLLGATIEAIWRIVWRDTDVGLELATDSHHVVIANEADEVFVSDGPLPLDYVEAARRVDV